ncbi:MAG: hypothetical protein ACFFAN_10550 [Promethearchaeota archaeon]
MRQELQKLYNATDNLVNQQFYKGGHDVIVGRTPGISVKIRASGQIIQKFKNIFNENIDLFLEGNYFQFLLPFKKIKGLNEENLKEVYKVLDNKIELIKENAVDNEIILLYTMVLSAIISKLRELHFNKTIKEIKRRIKNISKKNVSDTKIQESLNNLFMRNNENISILYNISYLDALAESFNYKKVAHICKIQKGKYMNRIVKLILSSIN